MTSCGHLSIWSYSHIQTVRLMVTKCNCMTLTLSGLGQRESNPIIYNIYIYIYISIIYANYHMAAIKTLNTSGIFYVLFSKNLNTVPILNKIKH